ncbi:MAG: hypothetical protein BMS9Abin05_2280 [Rhodothermia bacterium]|nr:MAG: hypothetical protein BMS9Abin05_2280 [Rhodothermia bacterium]
MEDRSKSNLNGQHVPGVKVPRTRKVGDIDALRAIHWSALKTAWRLMKREGITHAQQLSAIHAINQASGSYVKLLEQTDLTKQLESIKKELTELKQDASMRMVA